MKTLASILFILFFSVASLNAQIKVFSNGNTKVGYTSNTPSSLLTVGNTVGASSSMMYVYNTISGNTNGISAISPVPASGYNSTGIFGQAQLSTAFSVGKSRGLYGYAYLSTPSSHGRSYGVYGLAGNATSGFNYGVYGWLGGTNNGAAVYGSLTGEDIGLGDKYAGYFDGRLYVNGASGGIGNWVVSDSTTKHDIKQIEKAEINPLFKLNTVSYKYNVPQKSSLKTDTAKNNNNSETNIGDTSIYNKTLFGFISQDVEKIFPNLVHTEKSGLKLINYDSFIPLIVETLKEQHLVIDTLRRENEFFKQQLSTCCVKNQLKSMAALSDESINSGAVLYQNMPNSFSEKTEIKYVLPDNTGSAMICVYDMQGKQLKCYNIAGSGENSITIYGNELSAGMYLYTLIVNGKEVDTKRMILTN